VNLLESMGSSATSWAEQQLLCFFSPFFLLKDVGAQQSAHATELNAAEM
jgi:hypothetical protein